MTRSPLLDRRQFLRTSAVLGAGIAAGLAAPALGQKPPSETVRIGVMGCSRNQVGGDGRGTTLATSFADHPNADVVYVCDADQRNVGKAIESVAAHQERPPQGVGDFRRILDDPTVDALVIAAPDHWHGPATILACAAGKHVYVEKPCCHNPREGELMVQAADKHQRLVQVGTQRRSWPASREAIQRLHDGELGRVLLAKSWYFNPRPSIGRGREVPVPDWLDWTLWQGPAPERPYRDNVVHYNWHWFWHWGTSELGNNGVHTIDVCRWALCVDCPQRVTSSGGKFRYDDDQETPDTNLACFDFSDRMISWEGHSWRGRTPNDPQHEIAIYGESGVLTFSGGGYSMFDPEGKRIGGGSGRAGDPDHLANFIAGIREGAKLNADIHDCVYSTLLSHLGNIAYRTGHVLQLDPQVCRIVDDPEAQALWQREYRPGWEPKV